MNANKITALKKELFALFNETNKDIYGYGVIELKMTLSDGMIIFVSKHNRVPALIQLEKSHAQLKQSVDYALFTEFKTLLRARIVEKYNINPLAMLRDYDSTYHMAMTVVVLGDETLEKLLS